MFVTLEQQDFLNQVTEVLVNEEVDTADLELLQAYVNWLVDKNTTVDAFTPEDVVDQFEKESSKKTG